MENLKNKKIGWIGTGLMGSPMALHLVKAGFTVSVHTRSKSKAQKHIEAGCTWYDTPQEIANNSDIIFTMIGMPEDVEEVYFGKKGILKSIKKEMVLVDMTTTKPSLAKKIFEACKSKGATSVDAPVSGGEVGAIKGALSIMIGGEKQVVDDLMPVFDVFGKSMVYQGPAGAGQHTKMCNQITIAGTMIGICESLLYGHKAGLDLNTMLSSISKGAAACWSLDVLAPKIVQRDFAPGFMVEHFVKDLGIAIEEAEAMHLSLPGLALVKQLYNSLLGMGKGRDGTQALYLVLDMLAGGEGK